MLSRTEKILMAAALLFVVCACVIDCGPDPKVEPPSYYMGG